ncbi:MAG: hypothetical protein NTZ05_16890 [Chloroflexi bacterium]|nr:hypothetical protein [Chloroflexota bacterium]
MEMRERRQAVAAERAARIAAADNLQDRAALGTAPERAAAPESAASAAWRSPEAAALHGTGRMSY